ncbi:hypothetical protein HHI36_010395 [Cryptolaemus montrouzieri]|uniref:WASH complex subunit 3 n=1 Tax=Cryptolaemus montrouzieri TaxID=559131 RepID=A0ABD2MIK9_9CUCU
MNTVSFVNTFAQSCESRLMEFEFKLQKVDASLKILESQLSSIALDENITESTDKNLPTEIMENQSEIPEIKESASNEEIPQNEAPKPNEDPRYSKYFKMVQVGVPIPAVKLKMQSEGLDPNILDKI